MEVLCVAWEMWVYNGILGNWPLTYFKSALEKLRNCFFMSTGKMFHKNAALAFVFVKDNLALANCDE